MTVEVWSGPGGGEGGRGRGYLVLGCTPIRSATAVKPPHTRMAFSRSILPAAISSCCVGILCRHCTSFPSGTTPLLCGCSSKSALLLLPFAWLPLQPIVAALLLSHPCVGEALSPASWLLLLLLTALASGFSQQLWLPRVGLAVSTD